LFQAKSLGVCELWLARFRRSRSLSSVSASTSSFSGVTVGVQRRYLRLTGDGTKARNYNPRACQGSWCSRQTTSSNIARLHLSARRRARLRTHRWLGTNLCQLCTEEKVVWSVGSKLPAARLTGLEHELLRRFDWIGWAAAGVVDAGLCFFLDNCADHIGGN
jgi:hypothetical protein